MHIHEKMQNYFSLLFAIRLWVGFVFSCLPDGDGINTSIGFKLDPQAISVLQMNAFPVVIYRVSDNTEIQTFIYSRLAVHVFGSILFLASFQF